MNVTVLCTKPWKEKLCYYATMIQYLFYFVVRCGVPWGGAAIGLDF